MNWFRSFVLNLVNTSASVDELARNNKFKVLVLHNLCTSFVVKPTWFRSGDITGVELIPLDELTVKLSNGSVVKRPRIDVFASMVTSNTNWISLMLTSINLALNTTEDNSWNFLKKHYAENPMTDRLFGLPGAVLEGTGMNSLIPNTASWNITTINSDLADIYLSRVSYSWTLDEKGNIVINSERENYEYLLGKVDLITQNFDSTWRFFDSDDYYDWFGGLYNAAKQLGANPDTAFVDIRNKNEYISRTYDEELEFEIRSKILNPLYYNALFSTRAGSLSYAAQMQNLYGGLIVANKNLNTQLGNEIANTYLGLASGVGNVAQAAAWQSMAAWMMYLSYQGKWDANQELVTKLADNMIKIAIQYGVACCHHTCKNLDFNMKLIQSSSLSSADKAKYSQILAQATLTDPLYKDDSSSDNPNSDDANGDSSNTNNGNNQALVNGTTDSEQSSSGEAGGATAVGVDTSIDPGNAKAASSQSQDASSQSDSSKGESGGASVHEISKSSASKSAAGQSSTPVILIVAVICLIAIFVIGYVRNKHNDDEDDY